MNFGVESMYSDKQLTCVDCGTAFTFTAGEQERFAQLGFTNEPKRCSPCRAAKKAAGGGGGGGGGGRGGFLGGGGPRGRGWGGGPRPEVCGHFWADGGTRPGALQAPRRPSPV